MYEKFYGLKERPFSILPDPSFLYWSRPHELAFAALEYGASESPGFTLVTGDVGCGKTTLVRHLLNRLGDDVVVGLLTNGSDNAESLLQWVLMAFDQPFAGRPEVALYDQFRRFVMSHFCHGRRTLLIVDEAQNLGSSALEKLRLLSNVNDEKDTALQIVMVGQPSLGDILQRPSLRQVAQRITCDFHLGALKLEEMIGYIAHRVAVAGGGKRRRFTLDACRRIHASSMGIPRLVNLLCDTSLVYGFAQNALIVPACIVDEVIEDSAQHGVLGFSDGAARATRMHRIPRQEKCAFCADGAYLDQTHPDWQKLGG